ncbi:MAG: 30S ribosome-binding factor RbfA [Candidatus Omnitrophica bacterium]|nr:30S ribosome-binding factor RbfA [Candidatus Omnitrophota bacterium]
MTDRMDRIEKTIKREVTRMLQEDINDSRIEHVTITEVEVSRDLRRAKVFFVFDGDGKEKEKAVNALKHASKFVRGILAKRIKMKFSPEIFFQEDLSGEKEKLIDSLFEKIEKENPELKEEIE